MVSPIKALEITVSLVFFANKPLVLVGKRSGWMVGVIGAILSIAYFYLIDLYVYTALEFGLVVLMGYGFFKNGKRSSKVEIMTRAVLAVVMVALAVFVFSGLMTVVELLGALGMLWGAYYLTHERERLGWALYGSAHVLTAILGNSKGQDFLRDFQIASAIVCLVGVLKKE